MKNAYPEIFVTPQSFNYADFNISKDSIKKMTKVMDTKFI